MKPLLLALAVALAPTGSTQLPSPCDTATNLLSTSSFIECARMGTERYRESDGGHPRWLPADRSRLPGDGRALDPGGSPVRRKV